MSEGDHICEACKEGLKNEKPTYKEVPQGCMAITLGIVGVFFFSVFVLLICALAKIWG